MYAKENSESLPDKETSPKPGSRAYVGYDILRTASYLRRSYADIFDRRGITFQQYNVVRILRGAGPDGLPTLAIAERLIDETPGITRLLDRLEAKKLIRRERPASNRRQVICYATPKGLDLLRELDAPLRARVRTSAQELSDAEVEKLLEYLGRIRREPRSS
jgi:MarR family transcriptional regulator, organic hydroperoxide resistance regulator